MWLIWVKCVYLRYCKCDWYELNAFIYDIVNLGDWYELNAFIYDIVKVIDMS